MAESQGLFAATSGLAGQAAWAFSGLQQFKALRAGTNNDRVYHREYDYDSGRLWNGRIAEMISPGCHC